MMEPSFEYNDRHFHQDLCPKDEERMGTPNHGLYVDEQTCKPSDKLLEYLIHFRDTEKNFISTFGNDIEFCANGYKVKPCRACVRYDAVKTVIREHTKYCQNCLLQKYLLLQPEECLRSMGRSNMLKTHEGYVMDYPDMTGDYLKHCHDSMLPTYDDFCID